MTHLLRLQGRVFCGLALATMFASLAGFKLAALHELLAAAALLSLLGMPHGALDAVFARKLFAIESYTGWAAFALFYVGLSAAVVGVWFFLPTPFLCAFLLVSALHFGGDPAVNTSAVVRCLYGGSVIVLPALWHGPELEHLMGLVAGPASAAWVAPVLQQLAPPWLAATFIGCVLQAKSARFIQREMAFEMAALAALLVAATPLVSFTIYFCAMHSPRHILRTVSNLPAIEARSALRLALWPTLAVFAALAVGGWLSSGRPVQPAVMQLVFVGLAALTLPHMLLLERSRRAQPPANRR